MKQTRLARRYVTMFLNHVGGSSMKPVEELAAVKAIMDKSPEARGFFAGPQFSTEEKKAALDFLKDKAGLSEGTCQFLRFLADEDALGLMDEISVQAVALYLERARVAKATVIAPVEVPEPAMKRLKAALDRITGKNIELKFVKDTSLLGGVLVKVGSTMFDGSLKGQLRLLKEELVKG
ncbi:MAG: ATP synthase F1 subunit delta [Actinomycetota bacterium]|nr:ATP synthase F1 subunit delta [Actinomycetota bacterium]